MTVLKLGPVHEQMIDFMVANPGAKAEIIARNFGYSVGFVRALCSNDLFKSRLAERAALVSAASALEVSSRINDLAKKSLDRLLEKIQVEEKTEEIREVAKLALQGTGHLAPRGAPVSVHRESQEIHFHGVDQALLAAAREKMLGLQAPKLLDAPKLPEG